MKKKKELNGGMSGGRGRRRCRRGGKGMQLYAKFSAIFHRKAIQATAAEAETRREAPQKTEERRESDDDRDLDCVTDSLESPRGWTTAKSRRRRGLG